MLRATLLVASLVVAGSFAACSSREGEGTAPTVAASSSTTSGGGSDGGASPAGSGGAGGHGGQGGATSSVGGSGGDGGGCQDLLPPTTVPPKTLAETGLYSDPAKKLVAPHARSYEPQFKLWSDAAAKQRYVYLPECGTIDTSDMDVWRLPVGTRAWKEFSVAGKRIETRFMLRHGPDANDVLYATYVWNEEQTEANLVLDGLTNALGTDHDVPDQLGCKRCHGPYPAKGGIPTRFLGFGAVQLSHDGPGLTLDKLVEEQRLSHPPVAKITVPGNPVERAALGYLHVNCGTCHNDTPDGIFFPGFDARLKVGDADVATTGVYKTMVNQKTQLFVGYGCDYRIAGGSTTDSCAYYRMTERGTDGAPNLKQMPPLGTEVVDAAGLATLGAWIATLPPPAP